MQTYQTRKIKKDFVSFNEKIVTADEKVTKSTIENYFHALNDHAPENLRRYLTPDARINSFLLNRDNLTIDDVIDLRQTFSNDENNLLSFFFDEACILVKSPERVAVKGIITYVSNFGKVRGQGWFIFNLNRVNKEWLISAIDSHKF